MDRILACAAADVAVDQTDTVDTESEGQRRVNEYGEVVRDRVLRRLEVGAKVGGGDSRLNPTRV